jgi:hypothetical protein
MSEIDDIKKRAQEFLEKRRFERFKAGLKMSYRILKADERQELLKNGGYALPGGFLANAGLTKDLNQVLTEDISLGGLRISSPQQMATGVELWVNLGLNEVPVVINALATIQWSRANPSGGGYHSGLRFDAINQRDLAQVEAFLEEQKKAK